LFLRDGSSREQVFCRRNINPIGLEDVGDLIADLTQGLATLPK
jgi:hypothetical protein